MTEQAPTFDDMLAACIRACEMVQAHGSPEMRALARLLLFEAGRLAAGRVRLDG